MFSMKFITNKFWKQKKEKYEKNDSERWSEAHEDILLLIKTRLNLVDQIQFGVVCSGWNSLPNVGATDNLPWILGMQQDSLHGCRITGLYNPSTNKEYRIDHQLIKPFDCHNFREPYLYASKHGWVFLYVLPTNDGGECKFILLHAFTMDTIYLPNLNRGIISEGWLSLGTFSTVPTRSDCVFYTVHFNIQRPQGNEIVLSTYRHGDETWSTHKLSTPPHMLHDIIYMNNLLYCIFSHGEIWTFDIVGEEWCEILKEDHAVARFNDLHKLNVIKVVECNGELLLACFSLSREQTYFVHRLDWSRKAWVEEVGFKNLALFVGECSSHLVSVARDEDDEQARSFGYQMFPHNEYYGHISPFLLLRYTDCTDYSKEMCGFCPLLSKHFRLRVWVDPI